MGHEMKALVSKRDVSFILLKKPPVLLNLLIT